MVPVGSATRSCLRAADGGKASAAPGDRHALRPALPTVIGNDAVGRVLEVGPGVQNVKLGDRVLAPLSSFNIVRRPELVPQLEAIGGAVLGDYSR
jgi:NADPH:quinone reductase-like Zn-dependent oxidoreductase